MKEKEEKEERKKDNVIINIWRLFDTEKERAEKKRRRRII